MGNENSLILDFLYVHCYIQVVTRKLREANKKILLSIGTFVHLDYGGLINNTIVAQSRGNGSNDEIGFKERIYLPCFTVYGTFWKKIPL